jgi:hypothetical protein
MGFEKVPDFAKWLGYVAEVNLSLNQQDVVKVE